MSIEVKDARGIPIKIIGGNISGEFIDGTLDIKEFTTGRVRKNIPVRQFIADGDLFEIKKEYNKSIMPREFFCEYCKNNVDIDYKEEHNNSLIHLRNISKYKRYSLITKKKSLNVFELEKILDNVIT